MAEPTAPVQNPTERPNNFSEIGSTGLNRSGGYVQEEFLRELAGTRGVKTYREMAANEPVIGAIMFAVKMLLRQLDWGTQKASEQPEDVEAADFLKSCMDDMSTGWKDQISEILSFLTYGWSYHEIVYKRRGGDSQDPTQRSKYEDGRIGWRKVPIRAQETLFDWSFDDSGGIQGMNQLAPPKYIQVFVPIEKALLFRTTTEKGNPEGNSILRNAYRPWYFKKHVENIEGIGVERDLAGLPVAWLPPAMFSSNGTAEEKSAMAAYKKLISRIKRDEQEGICFPLEFDEKGNKKYDLTLLSTGSRRQFDTSQIINRYKAEIAMTALADFIVLGHEKVGSFSLASSKTAMFATALGAWADMICEVFNTHAVPRLFRLNPFHVKEYPKITHGDIESVDLAELGTFISTLAGSGANLFPDEELENHLRKAGGLPTRKVTST